MSAPKEFELHINLNLGKANAVMYAADLTEAYVDYNKGDVTDPTTLGGGTVAADVSSAHSKNQSRLTSICYEQMKKPPDFSSGLCFNRKS